jgi:hypothetical protein
MYTGALGPSAHEPSKDLVNKVASTGVSERDALLDQQRDVVAAAE